MPTLNKIYRYDGSTWVEVLDFGKFYLASNPSGYTTNKGTVTSVGAGTGLSISGTASVNPTVNVASDYKLPTTTEWSNKADKATTLSGYGITDAKIANGVITLGSNTITPLTSVPLAANGTRGGIQIGYTATGANIPLQLSFEKAYVALTSSAIVSALGYTPANEQDLESYYLPLAGGVMTGNIILNNSTYIEGKTTAGSNYSILGITDGNNIRLGNNNLSNGTIIAYNTIRPITTDIYDLGTSSRQWNNIYGKTLYENGTTLSSKYLGISAKASDSDKLDGQDSTYYLNYNNLTNKPTIPATNVIPATTTANKMLVSTTTSGTAKWSDWSSAGFLKTNTNGVVSVDTNSYLPLTGGITTGVTTLNNLYSVYYATRTSDTRSTDRWYNIGTISPRSGYINCTLRVTGLYNYQSPSIITINITSMNTNCYINQMSGYTSRILAIRCVLTENDKYKLQVKLKAVTAGTDGGDSYIITGNCNFTAVGTYDDTTYSEGVTELTLRTIPTSSVATLSDLSSYLPLSGGTLLSTETGILTLKRNASSGGAFLLLKNNNQNSKFWFAGMKADDNYQLAYTTDGGNDTTTKFELLTSGNIIQYGNLYDVRLQSVGTLSGTGYNIGTTKGNIHIGLSATGSGSSITDGKLASLTFGGSGSAYAGIYTVSSGTYGTTMILATTNSFNSGSYGRITIGANGNVAIGGATLSPNPAYNLTIFGQTYIQNDVPNALILKRTSANGTFVEYQANNQGTKKWRSGVASDYAYSLYYIADGTTQTRYWRVNTSGEIIGNTPSGANPEIRIDRTYGTDKTTSIAFGIGSGNTNRGIYDHTGNRWMIYADQNSAVFIPDWASVGDTNTPVYFSSGGRANVCTGVATKTYVDNAIAAAITTALNSSY